MFESIKNVLALKQKTRTYVVGLLQTKAYRTLKNHTTRSLVKYNISSVDWAILGILYDAKSGVRFTELAQETGVERPFITSVVDALKEKGYVSIASEVTDRRAKLIVLTKHGQTIVPKIEKDLRQSTETLLTNISIKDLYTYLKVLDKIVKNSENNSKKL